MMASYKGSCGSLSNVGGKQHENEVDCFSSEEQACQDLIANPLLPAAAKNYYMATPPCNQYQYP